MKVCPKAVILVGTALWFSLANPFPLAAQTRPHPVLPGPLPQPFQEGDVYPNPTPMYTIPAPREFHASADLPDIFFDRGSYVIRRDMRLVLDKNAKWLKENTNYLILIEGHTDKTGKHVGGIPKEAHNLILSHKRAQAVYQYLVSRGVNEVRITIVAYGAERPLNLELNEKERQLNRRAHFLIKTWN